MPFEDVDYWEELKRIMEWTKTNVVSTLHLCWEHRLVFIIIMELDKVQLPEKRSGLFWHHVRNRKIPIVRGFDDKFTGTAFKTYRSSARSFWRKMTELQFLQIRKKQEFIFAWRRMDVRSL